MRKALIILLWVSTLAVSAQDHLHISTDQGLSTNMLSTIIRDKNNFMWFGSYNGLHKHEGSGITVFNKVGKDSTSISGNEMHGLFEDRLGFIWIGSTNGLDKIDPVTGFIKHYKLRIPGNESAYIGYIYSIFQDKFDSMWISTDAALFRMNYHNDGYNIIPSSETANGIPLPVTGFKTGISTPQGLWIYTSNGMNFYDYNSHEFFHSKHNPLNKPIFRIGKSTKDIGASTDMVMGKDGSIYFVLNHDYLARYNLSTEKLDSFPLRRSPKAWYCCYSLAADSHGNIWVGTRHGGILVFKTKEQEFMQLRSENNNSLICSNYISSMCEDYQGRMWVTTDKGLDIVDLYNNSVEQKFLSTDPGITNVSFASGHITPDSNYLYIPFFEGGLLRMDQHSGEINHWPLTDTNAKRITYIFIDNGILLAAMKKGFSRLEIKQDRIVYHPVNSGYAGLLAKTSGDVVWAFKKNDQSVFFKKTNGMIYHYDGSDTLKKIASAGFRKMACISKDEKNLFYIDEDLNLASLAFESGQTIVYSLNEQLKKLDFLFFNPRDLCDDGNGNIWITSQNGLIRFQTDNRNVQTYSMSDGLSHNFTYALTADETGNLWISTLGGIDLYRQKTGRFQNVISFSSGAYMDAFGSSLLLPNGDIYFHTGNRITRISPSLYLQQQTRPVQLKLTRIEINGQPVNWNNIDQFKSLSYLKKRITISFSLLNFIPNSNLKYYYYLEGEETEWMETTRTEITYNSLQPGSFVFHVKAVDAAGETIDQEINLPFTIRPPFWKTWWFRLLVLSVICLLVYGFYKKRLGGVKEKAAFKQQMSELEARALRAQMNPHFIFNSLNAIQELIVTKNVTEAYQYLSHFSKLLRMVLNNSEKNFISLAAEIEMNRLYLELESLRFKQSFHYEITVNENVDEEATQVPSLLLQPFLENAIWHGLRHKEGHKKLTVSFTEKNRKLICRIEDNGVGREKAMEIKWGKLGAAHFESKGIILTEQRIKTLNTHSKENVTLEIEDLKGTDSKASGTRITLVLPQQ